MSRLPCGVAVVTAMDGRGVPRGFTCTSLCSVSVTPPLLLTCVRHDSKTLAAALRGGAFAVNVLHSGSRSVSELFASLQPDKFRHVAWQPGPVLAQPWLAGAATALLECSVVQSHAAGDHVVLVGLVSSAPVAGGPALVYCERSYRPEPAACPNGHREVSGR
jgi:flavin reductase (DIM6/NTAB) family NADH-FMN oxidoreductase RutF